MRCLAEVYLLSVYEGQFFGGFSITLAHRRVENLSRLLSVVADQDDLFDLYSTGGDKRVLSDSRTLRFHSLRTVRL